MKLTKEQAIDYSIELWEFLAKTGKEKEEWEGWEKYSEYGGLTGEWSDCFLCEYDGQERGYCDDCPYYLKFGDCDDNDTPFRKWYIAETPKTRKKYAKLFLKQLYQIKEEK